MASSTGEKFVYCGSINRRAREVKRSILYYLAILDVKSIDGFGCSVPGRKLRDEGELACWPTCIPGRYSQVRYRESPQQPRKRRSASYLDSLLRH
jgi:hypothetical protein